MVKLNFTFKDHIKDYIIRNNLFKVTKQTIYTLDQIMNVIEYILLTGSSWRSLDLPIFNNGVKWQSFYYHFQKFSKNKVFENVYKSLFKTYFKTNKSNKLKYLSIDSSFIKNEYASNVDFNGFCKKKRLSKLSLIVDSNGIPLSAILVKGNYADQTIFDKNINDMFIQIKSNTTNNKHKRYFLADTAYDTNKIRDKIKSMNIKPIIWYVKRHRIDKTKNKKFNKKETNIYKKRVIIENLFSWIFKNRRVSRRYDKSTRSYMSFLYMTFIKIIIRRM